MLGTWKQYLLSGGNLNQDFYWHLFYHGYSYLHIFVHLTNPRNLDHCASPYILNYRLLIGMVTLFLVYPGNPSTDII